MKFSEIGVEIQVSRQLEEALANTSLHIKRQDRWSITATDKIFDIVVYKENQPLAIIEIKTNLSNKSVLANATEQVRSAISVTNSRYGIVTNGVNYFFYDRNYKEQDFIELNFQDIVSRIIKPEKVKVYKKDKELIVSIILQAAEKHLQENTALFEFIKSESFLKRIKFDEKNNAFVFSGDDQNISSFENQFFIEMLGPFKETHVCRYTSLKTTFDIINYISFRMNGLVGMNDKSEINYVETYLNRIEKPLNKEDEKTINDLNNRYITSCSNILRKDDLTLWRLYSEDAKGACLVFEIKSENLNNQILIQKVKYADKNGLHKELEFLKQIKDEVESATGFNFEFRKLGYWKHFFKPFDYAVEEEIRLLVIDNEKLNKINKEWVTTYTHSIFNPIIDFRLNSKSFPIHLRKIILGPKCPEQDINCVQIQEMIRSKQKEIKKKKLDANFDELEVELSKIINYR
ncbi:hypothetical protein GCM10023189_00980 [Nibrella saemangeumensis]|uniref:Type I restriction enzyme R protein N-terminal domain-containing protein n=1 Tax=Nibrella saemangeumensis TaxID=1084526 RepID=A0ABP8MA60_9BACT